MIALAIIVGALAVIVVARIVVIRRDVGSDYVSADWRDEHFRERRDDV